MALELVNNPILNLILITIIPGIELRGSIPFGILTGMDPTTVFTIVVIFNTLMFFPIWWGINLFYDKWVSKVDIIKNRVDKIHRKGKPYIKKWGFLGLAIFIGIPLPGSGVYSGAMLAWLLGMKMRRAFPAALIGNLIAGFVVLLASLGASALL